MDGDGHTDNYPEQAPRQAASPSTPSSEHDYEEVQHEQIRRGLIILSNRSPLGVGYGVIYTPERVIDSKNEQPNRGRSGDHKGHGREAPARYDDAASSGPTPPPAKHRSSSPEEPWAQPSDRAHNLH